MIVVADTSPLNYLIQIDHDSLLPQLYQSVLVPTTVLHELRRASLPRVQQWLSIMPQWLQVQSVGSVTEKQLLLLDPGERDAIQLALVDNAGLLLIDERLGRGVANSLGIQTTGTLGVLLEAHKKQLVDGAAVFEMLITQTNFRLSKQLVRDFMTRLNLPK